jgi:hypothetical protein
MVSKSDMIEGGLLARGEKKRHFILCSPSKEQ